MSDPEITGADLERVIPKAVRGSKKALRTLMFSPWMMLLTMRISEWAWRRFKVTLDEDGRCVEDIVEEGVRLNITKLKNPSRAGLRAYCYKIAKNHCLNVITRERPREDDYRLDYTREHTPYNRNQRPVIEPCLPMMTEEEGQEEQRQESLRESRIAQIDETLRRVFNSLTPSEKKIVSLWAGGMTFEEISKATDIPLSTVHRRMKKLQKAFVREIGRLIEEIGESSEMEDLVASILAGLTDHKAARLRALLASGLRGTAPHAHAPHAAL